MSSHAREYITALFSRQEGNRSLAYKSNALAAHASNNVPAST